MPEGFAFPVSHQYWVPLRIDPRAVIAPGTGPSLNVFGRLAGGTTKETADAELKVVTRRLSGGGPPELIALQPRVLPYTEVFLPANRAVRTERWQSCGSCSRCS